MKIGELTFQIKELNNKSRKGPHIYVKGPKGTRGAYLKYEEDVPVDFYLQHYIDIKNTKPEERRKIKFNKKKETYRQAARGEKPKRAKKQSKEKKPKSKEVTQAKKFLAKIRKQHKGKTIDQIMKRGIGQNTIKDIEKASLNTINMHNQKCLERMVLDKDVRKLMAKEENMQKIKNRLEQRITIIGKSGEALMSMNIIGKTTAQAITDLRSITRKGDEIKKTRQNVILKQFETMGYRESGVITEGEVSRIQLTTIVRKAK